MSTETNYQALYEEEKRKNKLLSTKVRDMLATQKAYFKSNKDTQLLIKAKALEKEVDDIINPKPMSQAQMEFLGR
jgi:hypothetical protein